MATGRARSKLQRLLKDLDLEDSTTVLPDTPLRPEGSGAALDLGAGLGFSEDGSELDSSSVFSSEFESPLPARQAHLAAEKQQHMERRAMQLMQEHKALQAKHQRHVHQAEADMARMQAQFKAVVEEMEKRQREVEARAPAVKSRLEDYRDRMQDLRISESQYQELLALPPEGLHVVDQVKVTMYEHVREASREAEHLRLALSSSREACSRMEGDMARSKAECTRAAAQLVEKDKEMQDMMGSFQARVGRLSSELEQALIRAELNSAKGQMYDELRAKAERLQLDNQRLAVVEATFRRFEQQATEAEKQHRQRDHSLEMLQMDKAYLSKQVEFMGEQQRKMQGELEMREQQVQELQRVRQELYEKLVVGESSRGRQDDVRLQKELERLQASTHADLERIRLDTTETYEREARLLREMRDQAVEEAGRLRLAHAELKDHLERARSVTAEVQRQLEGQVVELQSELRQKAFELGHLRVVLGEKEGLLNHANLQVDLLQEKMQLLRDRSQALEADLLAAGMRPRAASGDAGGGRGEDDVAAQRDNDRGGSSRGADAVHAAALAALRKERTHLQSQVAKLQASLKEARGALELVGQPHAFLLEQLTAAKAAEEEAWRSCAAAQTAALEREQAASAAAEERDALRRDLDALLVQRQGLDRMKQLVMRAVGAGGTAGFGVGAAQVGAGAGGGPVLLHGLGAAGATSIVE